MNRSLVAAVMYIEKQDNHLLDFFTGRGMVLPRQTVDDERLNLPKEAKARHCFR